MEPILTNLFTETERELARNGHTFDNVEHVTLYGTGIELDDFVEFAKAFDYDSSYGHEYVPPFVIKMHDGSWYERAEYDGSEWWSFNKSPKAPKAYSRILSVLVMNDRDWLYREASALAESIDYEEMWADMEEEYEAALYEERMDAICDEIEGDLDRRRVYPNKGDWHDCRGKCAYKARCTREVRDESRYGTYERWATKPNSRCWKDQRGTGRGKRDHQYRAVA